MNYKFTWIDKDSGQRLRSWVRTLPTQIGRGIFTDICIDSGSISRRHCEFTENKNGELVVADLNSKNGVMIDGKLVNEAVVPPGAEIRIGLVTVQVEPTDEPVNREAEAAQFGQQHADETQAVRMITPQDDRYEID
ncbi:FHA domain-containing protein [Stieleria varia]|uniref:Glycogen accumulation regulator GarA n=1 Tax=Stieleria varia TaxID=2528005 RepID=A0A5C6AP09_9BACT|nr:FHA domain-containing protein [Stieleria varia]TWU01247.1 Glycogen accumulation regulator GarA [Stieleria varia]